MATPTKKSKRKGNHHVPHHGAPLAPRETDYESDLPPMHPPPLSRTNEELNLRVLRRYDPSILQIISVASYAVLYFFSPTSQAWEKADIEGSLFIVHHEPRVADEERFSVFVLNRRGMDNFSLDLVSEEDVELTDEYIILKVEEPETHIYGLWVFTEPPPSSTANAKDINAQIILECATRAGASRKLIAEKAAALLAQQKDSLDQLHMSSTVDTEPPIGAPMTKQLSLREIFGHQREQDGGFSLHNHHSQDQPVEPPPPTSIPKPQFITDPDTEFFRTGPRTITPKDPSETKATAPAAGTIALDDLFRRAGKANG